MVSKKYNVILIIADSLRKDHVGCYGNEWIHTPNLDKFSKESVMFTKAYPESLPTIPVRRAIYTGNRVFPFKKYELKKDIRSRRPGWEPLSNEDISISEIFRLSGFRTALIGDNYHLFEPGMNFNRGFLEWIFIRGQENDMFRSAHLVSDEELDKYLPSKLTGRAAERRRRFLRRYLSNVSFRKNEEDWFAPQTFREGVRWLRENRDAERFLLVLEPFDPHEPWDPPHEFVEMYDPDYEGKEVITPKYGYVDYLTERELKHMRAHYAGEVTLLDKWFGYFLQKVYELNLHRNTIIAFISDHGHQLGEHNLTGKVSWGLYPELVDIPLLIRHPEEIGAGEKIDYYVYNHDLFTTLASMAGINFEHKVDGINIWKYVEKEKNNVERSYVTSALSEYVMYRDDEYWYISNREGKEAQLYAVKEDPNLERNIAEECPEICRKLYRKIVDDAGGSLPKLELPPREAFEWYDRMYFQMI